MSAEQIKLTLNQHSLKLNLTDSEQIMLLDIEAPLTPSFDWFGLAEIFIWGVLVVLFLGFMLNFSQRFYHPCQLAWQLKHFKNKINTDNNQFISPPQVWLFYKWCLKLQIYLKVSTLGSNKAFESLMSQVNKASFSKQIVSRETLLALILLAESIVNQPCSWSGFKVSVLTQMGNLQSSFAKKNKGNGEPR